MWIGTFLICTNSLIIHLPASILTPGANHTGRAVPEKLKTPQNQASFCYFSCKILRGRSSERSRAAAAGLQQLF